MSRQWLIANCRWKSGCVLWSAVKAYCLFLSWCTCVSFKAMFDVVSDICLWTLLIDTQQITKEVKSGLQGACVYQQYLNEANEHISQILHAVALSTLSVLWKQHKRKLKSLGLQQAFEQNFAFSRQSSASFTLQWFKHAQRSCLYSCN